MNSDDKVLVRWLKHLAEHAPTMEIKHAISIVEEIGELHAEAIVDIEALALLAHTRIISGQTIGRGRLAIAKAVKRSTDCYDYIKGIPTDGNAIDELMAKWEKGDG